MVQADNWLKLILAGFGFLALLAFAVAYYKAKVTETQLIALRGDRDDLDKRVRRLEDDKTRLEGENATLVNKVAVLENLISPTDSINKLIVALDLHDRNVTARYEKYDEHVKQILDHLDLLVEAHNDAR